MTFGTVDLASARFEQWFDTPEALAAFGGEIAALLAPGDAVCLWGPLGAGKSTLARGLIRALTSPDEEVPSPTFTLVQLYAGRDFPIAHFDLYRLKSADEAYELGLDEALDLGVAVIEWPERLGDALPPSRLDIELTLPSPGEAEGRRLKARGHGELADFTKGLSAVLSDLSTDRDTLKRRFLADAGLADARRETMSGDASTRLYDRLHLPNGKTLILMDQPPAAESEPAPPDATPEERAAKGYNALARLAAGRVDAFVAVASYLKGRGFSAPEIVAFDVENGLAVLEDLGDDLYATLIANGADPLPLYEAAVDLQVALHSAAAPDVLETKGVRWPLSTYDDLALKTYTELFLEWWPKYANLPPFPDEARTEWDVLVTPIRAAGERGATVFAHRDFHAENLIWLPEARGPRPRRPAGFPGRGEGASGLGHAAPVAGRPPRGGARRWRPPCWTVTLAARPELDRDAFLKDYRALAALNAARILGPIFARQVVFFGRPKYVAFMPRTWRYLERNLAHPDLAGLRGWFDRWIPEDTRP